MAFNANIEQFNGQCLSHAFSGDAGLDIHMTETLVLRPGFNAPTKLGIKWAPNSEHVFADIRMRSSVAWKFEILGGVIDSGFRGEWYVNVRNRTSSQQTLKIGERYFQVIIQRYMPTLLHDSGIVRGIDSSSTPAQEGMAKLKKELEELREELAASKRKVRYAGSLAFVAVLVTMFVISALIYVLVTEN